MQKGILKFSCEIRYNFFYIVLMQIETFNSFCLFCFLYFWFFNIKHMKAKKTNTHIFFCYVLHTPIITCLQHNIKKKKQTII
jgi:hypothetical protein